MSDNWVIANLENAFNVWNAKMAELWGLVTQSPETFKGGTIWNTIVTINGGMLNELIDKIEVHQSERIDGVNVQKLTIHYNCIGSIEIPDFEKIPEVSVTIPTRQGVETSYAGTAIAI